MTRNLGSRYVLEQVIGRGGFGEVWRGRDLEGTPRAFKLLHSGLGSEEHVIQRFVQERSILMSLTHPNLVRVHDMVVEGESLALVMDLVEGGDLRSRLRAEPPLEWGAALRLAMGVAAGLGAAHARGVIHRDVKPENVLLDVVEGETVAKLVDFGISKITGSGKTATVLAGTLTYVAPELFDERPPSVASDLYAFGIMLYELTSGAPPFRSDSFPSLMRMHAQEPPSRPGGVDDGLWSLIKRLLAKEPGDRPASAAVVVEELRAMVGAATPEPTVVRPVGSDTVPDLAGSAPAEIPMEATMLRSSVRQVEATPNGATAVETRRGWHPGVIAAVLGGAVLLVSAVGVVAFLLALGFVGDGGDIGTVGDGDEPMLDISAVAARLCSDAGAVSLAEAVGLHASVSAEPEDGDCTLVVDEDVDEEAGELVGGVLRWGPDVECTEHMDEDGVESAEDGHLFRGALVCPEFGEVYVPVGDVWINVWLVAYEVDLEAVVGVVEEAIADEEAAAAAE